VISTFSIALRRNWLPTRGSGWLFALYLFSLPTYCLVRLSGDSTWIWLATAFTCISWFFCSLQHTNETHGATHTGSLLLSGFAIALLFEHLGSTYGFLFGNYHYTDLLGFKVLGSVPVIIPVAWFMMLYPAWAVAGFVTRRMRGIGRLFARIVCGAAAMTAWDLSLDPRWVADGAWAWHDGGSYFGIPLSNFLGWFVTAALIYCVWSLLLRRRLAKSPEAQPGSLALWIYIVTWLGESAANGLFWGGPVLAGIVFVAMGLFGAPVLRAEIKRLR
jgi:putative membrane protein